MGRLGAAPHLPQQRDRRAAPDTDLEYLARPDRRRRRRLPPPVRAVLLPTPQHVASPELPSADAAHRWRGAGLARARARADRPEGRLQLRLGPRAKPRLQWRPVRDPESAACPPSLSPESASYPPPLLVTPSHLCDRYDTYNYRGGRTSDPPASAAYHPQSSWWPRTPEGHDSAAYHPQVSDSAGYHPQPPASAAYHPQPPAPATTASASAASSPSQARPAGTLTLILTLTLTLTLTLSLIGSRHRLEPTRLQL